MPTPIAIKEKDPDAVKDYTLDWSDWLDGDTIATSVWVVPAGITEDSESESATSATIWLSGGTAPNEYEITNRITTAGGRSDDRTILICVVEK